MNTYCLPASLRPTLLQRFVRLREVASRRRSNEITQDNASWFESYFSSAKSKLNATLESVIDAVLHPEIRDRMIMFRGADPHPFPCSRSLTKPSKGRYDLVDCLHDYRLAVKIHGDEILNHANWEISVGVTENSVRNLLKRYACSRKNGSDVIGEPNICPWGVLWLTVKYYVVCLLTHKPSRWSIVGDENETTRNLGFPNLQRHQHHSEG